MPRGHERAHALLGERVRLGTRPRRALYAILLVLLASGVWWMLARFSDVLTPGGDDLARLATEAWAMKLHGAAAIMTLLVMGAMLATHSRLGWRLRRNRISGTAVVTALTLLAGTGYALYYLVDDASRPAVSALHWAIGLVLVPGFIAHIVLGRRSRGR